MSNKLLVGAIIYLHFSWILFAISYVISDYNHQNQTNLADLEAAVKASRSDQIIQLQGLGYLAMQAKQVPIHARTTNMAHGSWLRL